MTTKIKELLGEIRALREAATPGPLAIRYETEKDKATGEEKLNGKAVMRQDKPGGVLVAYTTNRDGDFFLSAPTNQDKLERALIVAIGTLEAIVGGRPFGCGDVHDAREASDLTLKEIEEILKGET